jgi:hypothetical protein
LPIPLATPEDSPELVVVERGRGDRFPEDYALPGFVGAFVGAKPLEVGSRFFQVALHCS